MKKNRKKLIKKRKPNRSVGGDVGIYILLILFGAFFALPLVYSICTAFKPLDEIYIFPPKFYVKNPTMDNFADLFNIMGQSFVPFSRYIFNSVFMTAVGTLGNVVFCSRVLMYYQNISFREAKVSLQLYRQRLCSLYM